MDSLMAQTNNMFVVKYRKIFYTFSLILVVGSIIAMMVYGLNFGIDFKGGAIVEVDYSSAPNIDAIKASVDKLALGDYSVRATGATGVILRTRDLSETERGQLSSALVANDPGAQIKQFDSVGPVLGQELTQKALWSIFFVILAIVLFITFAFRHVSRPVSSWKYGVVAIIALIHDVIVPTGVFALLGHFAGIEIDALFVTALLVILGFSVHDTIVVFDRTRENLRHGHSDKKSFEEVVGESVSQTFTRSINTSLTVLLSLAVLYFVGPETTRNFSLALFVGIIAGTYSSIFLGSPLLVTLQKMQEKKSK